MRILIHVTATGVCEKGRWGSLLDYQHHSRSDQEGTAVTLLPEDLQRRHSGAEAAGVLLPLLHWECVPANLFSVWWYATTGSSTPTKISQTAHFGRYFQFLLPPQSRQHTERPIPPIPLTWNNETLSNTDTDCPYIFLPIFRYVNLFIWFSLVF